MTPTPVPFFVTGGTLSPNDPSYIVRQADQELYDGLRQGDFCYVLTSRQKGKSSLMLRTAARLRQEGVAVVVLDLTGLGSNLTVEQWYDGLLSRVGQQLDLEDALDNFWLVSLRLGPLQRWMEALRQVVLPRLECPLVICIDEIDYVRSLPFATNEFFAAIRESYIRRAEEPTLARLTFCVFGVATPIELIQDTHTTPFNIGRRIVLTDFTSAEAVSLLAGLKRPALHGAALLQRTLWWSGGQPYLTQRLCQAVATTPAVTRPRDVDRLCAQVFFSPEARERDLNLPYVWAYLMRNTMQRISLLDMYARITQHQRIRDDETNPVLTQLKLSGITRVVNGYVRVHNPIYGHVFDRDWIRTNMPDIELSRPRGSEWSSFSVWRNTIRLSVGIGVFIGLSVLYILWSELKNSTYRSEQHLEYVLQAANSILNDFLKISHKAVDKKSVPLEEILHTTQKAFEKMVFEGIYRERDMTIPILAGQMRMLLAYSDLHSQLGDLPLSLTNAQRSLAIAKKLSTQDANNSRWKQALSISYERVGDLLLQQDNLREALDAYQASLFIQQDLSQQDTRSSEWQSNSSAVQTKIDNLRKQQRDLDGR
jgi:hypothetical protein